LFMTLSDLAHIVRIMQNDFIDDVNDFIAERKEAGSVG
jgi:uncharacterized protein YeeX (DUF496 family)